MLEIGLAMAAGIVLGVVSGTIPGLSPSKMLLLATTLIVTLTPLQMAVLYMTMMVVSQYVDAIPAMYLGVPGEVSAIPAADESKNLHQQHQVSTAIKLTAAWRLLGTVLMVGVTALMLEQMLSWPQVFSVKVQVVLLTVAVLGIWFTAGGGAKGIVLMLIGYLLGSVGFHFYLGQEVGTFGLDVLYDGLPLVAVIMGLYVTPQVFKIDFVTETPRRVQDTRLSWQQIWQHRVTGIWSSVQGFIVGIVPGLSFVLSSTMCYNTARQRHPGDPVSAVIASETGTTTGMLSSLIPLFLFGIPITLSESIIFTHMIESGAVFQQGQFLTDNIVVLLAVFVAANLIALLLSWPLAPRIMQIFRYLRADRIRLLVIAISVLTVIMMGMHDQQLAFYLACYVILAMVGILLRNLDLLPLIFVFVLQDSIDHAVWTLVQII